MPLTVTPANVRGGAGASTNERTAGVALAAGDLVYLDANDLDVDSIGKAKLCDANAGVSGVAAADGICLHAAAVGQPVVVANGGANFVPGATLVPGMRYVASDVPGKISAIIDMASGWYLTDVGYAVSTTILNLAVNPTGVVM